MRILSGIQPSGALHLGNYFAMMKRMIEYQEHHELFCFVVNYHALTSVFDAQKLRQGTFEAVCDFLALGIDPHKSYFYIQSDVPECTELTWILSNATPMGLLERAHSFKDKKAKGIAANHGLFAYPVLMAADILLYQANLVPVGKDQKQHVEMTRDIAIRFNQTYGETFVLPEPEIPKDVAVVPGIDGQKMSKSYGNTIDIFCAYDELKQKVMAVKTDATPVNEPKNPDQCTLFALYSLFLDKAARKELRERYLKPGLKYSDIKKELTDVIWNYFAPYRDKREDLIKNREGVLITMKMGAEKARSVGSTTLQKVRENVGLNY